MLLSLAQCCRTTKWSYCRVAVHRRCLSSASVPAPPYKILFCGTDSFAAKSLQALVQHRSSLCPELYVLTPPDVVQTWGAKRMRISPVKALARQHELPHQDVPHSGLADYHLPPGFVSPSSSQCPPSTILLTCSFGHMIPDTLLRAFPYSYQRLNIHPSLLPNLRGAAPIQWAISRRLDTSGISIQSLASRKFDSGRILAQQTLPFPPSEASKSAAYSEIEAIMADHAATLLIRMFRDLPTHVERSWDQDSNQVSRAPKIKLIDCKIEFDSMNADQIVANDKAFSYLHHLYCSLVPQKPGFPNLETSFHKLAAVSLSDVQNACEVTHAKVKESEPGWATYSPGLDAIIVKCPDDERLLHVHTLQSKGKKVKTARDWWTAYRDRATSNGMLYFK